MTLSWAEFLHMIPWKKKKETELQSVENVCSSKDTIKKMKRQATDFLQILYLIKYPEHIKDSYNSR